MYLIEQIAIEALKALTFMILTLYSDQAIIRARFITLMAMIELLRHKNNNKKNTILTKIIVQNRLIYSKRAQIICSHRRNSQRYKYRIK